MIEVLLVTVVCMAMAAIIAFIAILIMTDGRPNETTCKDLRGPIVWVILVGIFGCAISSLCEYREWLKDNPIENRR